LNLYPLRHRFASSPKSIQKRRSFLVWAFWQSMIECRFQGFWADILLVTPFATTFGEAAVAA